MDPNKALGQIRPYLQLAGAVLIAIGLAKFFGVHINLVGGTGLEIGVAGFLMKNI